MRIFLPCLLLCCLCSCSTRSHQKFGSKGTKIFASDGDCTVPDGVTVVEVRGRGGSGGGAGGGCCSFMSGSGGGGACSVSRVVTVMPGTSYHITIGAAGRGGKGNNSGEGAPGGDGGTSSFLGLWFPFPGRVAAVPARRISRRGAKVQGEAAMEG
jgi:hypothetical protein